MGKYSSLTNEERSVLLKLADVAKTKDAKTWIVASAKDGSCLIAIDGESGNIIDVPGAESFYLGLREKGFVALSHGSSGSVQICVQQSAMDYKRYAAKTGLGRWLEDRSYDLVQEQTVFAKLAWLVLAYALGFLSAILLRLLGWVTIGN